MSYNDYILYRGLYTPERASVVGKIQFFRYVYKVQERSIIVDAVVYIFGGPR
jgi:hypothetical protein